MASRLKCSLPDLPESPFHPKKQFSFPKRSFGKTKPVSCSCKTEWFGAWPFLHYDEAKDVVYCHTCVTAVKLEKLKASSKMSTSFVSSLHNIIIKFIVL